MKGIPRILSAISVAVLVFMVFLPALNNDFINWDDDKYVYANKHIKSLDADFFRWAFLGFSGYKSDYWMPLSHLSHAVVYAISGADPMAHHLVNNLIHCMNAGLVVLLVFMLIRAYRRSYGEQPTDGSNFSAFSVVAAATTGLFFGLHPLRVESVAWISERKDILSAFFCLLAVISYLRYADFIKDRQPGIFFGIFSRKYLLALCMFVLALSSKPMAVSFPFVLLVLDWHPLRRLESVRASWPVLIEKLPFFALSLASAFITMMAQKGSMAIKSVEFLPLSLRFSVVSKTLVDYLRKMIMPVDLVPWYSYPSDAEIISLGYGLPALLVLAVTVACIWQWKRQKLWLSVWAYFLVTLSPVLGIIVPIPVAMADRYTYLPCLGLTLVVGLGAGKAYEKIWCSDRPKTFIKMAAPLILVVILSALAYATARQISIWNNSIVFWNYFIEKEPNGFLYTAYNYKVLAHNNLGNAYLKNGLVNEAINEFLKALNYNQDDPYIHNNLGNAYAAQGRLKEAIKEYRYSIHLNNELAEVHNNLGRAYSKSGMPEDAVREYEITIRLEPDHAAAHENLGQAYREKGLVGDAIGVYKRRLESNPDDIMARYNLGVMYMEKGLIDMARKEFELVLKSDPNHYWAKQMMNAIHSK